MRNQAASKAAPPGNPAAPLFLPYAAPPGSTSRFDAPPAIVLATKRGGTMLDIIFLALGLGGFALMAAYATLCAKL